MIAEYKNKSLVFIIPGLFLQIVSAFIWDIGGIMTPLGYVFFRGGFILLLVGLYFFAQAKGRNPIWCLVSFLSFIGLIVIACLKDKSTPEAPKITSGDNMQQ